MNVVRGYNAYTADDSMATRRPTINFTSPFAIEPADFDNDSDIDGNDFLIWQRNVGITTGATHDQGDASGNGAVDHDDLVIWQSSYPVAVSTVQSVPEPHILGLALVVMVVSSGVVGVKMLSCSNVALVVSRSPR